MTSSASAILAPRARRFCAAVSLIALALSVPFDSRLLAAGALPPPPKVTVAPVEEKFIAEYEEVTGRVDAAETVELRARVSGHLDAVHFHAGQEVAKGDLLFTIDSRWYRAQFDLTKALAEQARARAEVADREAQRATDLLAAAAISREEADARKSRAIEARAAVAAAEAARTTAQLDLENTEVRAPIAGRVSRAIATAGNLVSGAPGNATLLTTIVSTGEAFVYADLDEGTVLKFNRIAREHGLVTDNGRVPVELQLSDETGFPRHGFLESVDNRLNPQTGSLVLRFVFENTDGALIPGLFARVRVPVSAPQRTLLVSDRAIGTDQSQKFVLALGQNNTVVYRTVKVGGSIDGKRVVRDGLAPTDQVVVNGLQRVRPGMTVAPERLASAEPVTGNSVKVASR
jgi:multidrug efflux system membrane fusion protein